MAVIPHFVQSGKTPAITGTGFGLLGCRCGESLLIAGYEPRQYLGISIECAACGQITDTPGLPEGMTPPASVTLIERGTGAPPPPITAATVLISREEMERLSALYEPRPTTDLVHKVSDTMLDDIEFQQSRWTEVPLDPSPDGYRDQPLAWAVKHFRERLRDPDWTTFASDDDGVAMTVLCAFRDMYASWVNHPLFGAMVRTAGAQGFSLHAMATFGAAKALAMAGNRVGFTATEGPRARILSQKLAIEGQTPISIAVNRFDKYEWPNGGKATPQNVLADVLKAMDAARGHINRLHPGILVLSSGASAALFDQYLTEALFTAIAQHGRRHRGLTALALIMPKIGVTGQPREVKFGYTFYPVPNRADEAGRPVRVGTRADYAGIGPG
jgi:hypothetical protein